MSLYTTQFQGPVMAATQEQSLLETHVCIAGDRFAYRLSPAVRSLLKQRLHKL